MPEEAKVSKGSTISKIRRRLARHVKKRLPLLKRGDITFFFHLPAHKNGKFEFVKKGLQPQQSVSLLLAVSDLLPYPDVRLDKVLDKARALAVATAAMEGNAPCAAAQLACLSFDS
jgi:hypothetical protein